MNVERKMLRDNFQHQEIEMNKLSDDEECLAKMYKNNVLYQNFKDIYKSYESYKDDNSITSVLLHTELRKDLGANVITKEEFLKTSSMIESEDKEMNSLAKTLINEYRTKRIRKLRGKR